LWKALNNRWKQNISRRLKRTLVMSYIEQNQRTRHNNVTVTSHGYVPMNQSHKIIEHV
jgi:hypothetical protein